LVVIAKRLLSGSAEPPMAMAIGRALEGLIQSLL